MHDEILFSALADIVNGYSRSKIKGQEVYIKHLDLKSELAGASVYKKYYLSYKESGVPTREDRLAFLKEEGDWLEADEAFVSRNKKFVENLLKTKEKLILKSQMDDLDKTIRETQDKLSEKIITRETLIGATCEKYAGKKKEESQILASIFKDSRMKELLLNEEEAEYAEQQDLNDIFDTYFSIFADFSDATLKSIAVSNLFYNFFSLVPKENPCLLFNKPVIELTFFQQKLLHYSQNLRYIYENVQNIPDEIKNDYDNLVEFSKKEKINKKSDKSNNGYSVVGASKKDLKMAGVDTENAVSPFDMLRRSGKNSLDKRDFAKMAGT